VRGDEPRELVSTGWRANKSQAEEGTMCPMARSLGTGSWRNDVRHAVSIDMRCPGRRDEEHDVVEEEDAEEKVDEEAGLK
jgi:hypothetical protein